jgi:hypothetical protein
MESSERTIEGLARPDRPDRTTRYTPPRRKELRIAGVKVAQHPMRRKFARQVKRMKPAADGNIDQWCSVHL